MRLLATSLFALLSSGLSNAQEPQISCVSESRPNPIATQYFANITGTLNGTLAILPIPFSLARSIIPPQYQILTSQYRELLPHLPSDTYPALLQAVFDHDIRFMDYVMPDFSRASIEFPFIKYFDDAEVPFRYIPDMFMTATNEMSIAGSREYGGAVYPATFEPSCNAYAPSTSEQGSTVYSVEAEGTSLRSIWRAMEKMGPMPFPMTFFKHTVNQPVFGVNGFCNHQIRMFDTDVSKGDFVPRRVSGTVRAQIPDLFNKEMVWPDAIGVQVDTAFIERHMIPCEDVRSWKYVDDGLDYGMEGTDEIIEGYAASEWKLDL